MLVRYEGETFFICGLLLPGLRLFGHSVSAFLGKKVISILFIASDKGVERLAENFLEKTDLLLLTKHATEKDTSRHNYLPQSLTFLIQMSAARRYGKTGFLRDGRSDIEMVKVNYPENTLFYVNQAILIMQKDRNILHYTISCLSK